MSDHDRDREGGGLAVLVLAGFLVLLVFAAGGCGWFYLRYRAMEQINEFVAERELAEYNAQQRAAAKAAASAPVATPAPSAPEAPPPTQ